MSVVRGTRRRLKPGQAGFTLLEAMIVVSILGVLASLAIPAFGDLIKNNRRTTIVNELVSSMMLARAEAAKRGIGVVVCGVDDANGNHALEASEQTCTGLDWRDGWIVALWNNADADNVLDSGELVLPPAKVFLNDYDSLTVTGISSTFSNAPAAGAIALMPFNQTGTGAQLNICDQRGASRSRAIIIGPNGRPRIVMNDSEDAANGATLACP